VQLSKFGVVVALIGASLAANGAQHGSCLVAIDAGHSESAPGSVSARGISEFVFNRNIANLLLERIRKDGVAEAFRVDGAGVSLQKRTEEANLRHASFLISIHHDSVQLSYLSTWTYRGTKHRYSDRFHGFSLFVSRKNPQPEESLKFAQSIGTSLLKSGFRPTLHHAEKIAGENRELVDRTRGIYVFDDLIVLKTAVMPAVLLECGIIVNRKEEALLTNRAYQRKMVKAVAKGIEKACAASRNEP
jgi:N-acetylmuramoyl-L-alanine amidase